MTQEGAGAVTANDLRPPRFDDVVAARALIGRYLRKTPLIAAPALSELLGCDYYLKAEIFQPTGAFKVRGGINFMRTLTEKEKRREFVSASAGNHGQSLAYGARLFGAHMIIYMPAENPNRYKLEAIRKMGAEVRTHGRDTEEAVLEAQRVARDEGLRYVHHANEPKLIAGVGTMALEIFENLPDCGCPDRSGGSRELGLRQRDCGAEFESAGEAHRGAVGAGAGSVARVEGRTSAAASGAEYRARGNRNARAAGADDPAAAGVAGGLRVGVVRGD